MSPDNYSLNIVRTSPDQDHLRVFLRSSGADLDRRVWVRQFSDGLWYVINNSDTYVKVREPAAAADNTQHDADFDAAPASPAGGVNTATPPAPQEPAPGGADNTGQGDAPSMSTW